MKEQALDIAQSIGDILKRRTFLGKACGESSGSTRDAPCSSGSVRGCAATVKLHHPVGTMQTGERVRDF
jgi:hypothetical protein